MASRQQGPGRPPSTHTLGFEVLGRLRLLLRRISVYSTALAQETGLTVPQLICLKTVGDHEDEGATGSLVADEAQLSPATVSRIVERLVRAGLIARERSTRDRRRVLLRLTPDGRTRYREMPQPLHQQFLDRFDALDVGEQDRLFGALDTLCAMMDATEMDGDDVLS